MDDPSESETSPRLPEQDDLTAQAEEWVIRLPENGDVITSLATRNS
jgi:hypothetical protein